MHFTSFIRQFVERVTAGKDRKSVISQSFTGLEEKVRKRRVPTYSKHKTRNMEKEGSYFYPVRFQSSQTTWSVTTKPYCTRKTFGG